MSDSICETILNTIPKYPSLLPEVHFILGYTWANTRKDLNSLFQLTEKLENLWKSCKAHKKGYRVKYFNSLLAGNISNAIYYLNKLKKSVNSQRNLEAYVSMSSVTSPELPHRNSEDIFIKLTHPRETLIESDSTKFEDDSEPTPSSIEQLLTDPVEELFIPLRRTEDSKTADPIIFCTCCKQALLKSPATTLSCTHPYHNLCLRQFISNCLVHSYYPITCLDCCREIQEPDICELLSPEDYDSYLNLSFQFSRGKTSEPFLCSSYNDSRHPGHNYRSQSVCKCPSCDRDWPTVMPPCKITCSCMRIFCSFCFNSKCAVVNN